MYWSNYHSHCTYCDGRSSMEDFVRFAIAKGLKKYGFSSHAPLPFLTKWTMPEDDFEDYEKEFYRLKDKYKNEIELFIGLEVDYIQGCSDIKNEFFTNKKLDYSIGSIHYLDKISKHEYWSIDGDFETFEKGLNLLFGGDIQSAAERFFEITRNMIDKGDFDMVGHLDKITYHGLKIRNFDIESKWFYRLVTDVLELIKTKQMILEINTKSLNEHGITFPHQQFYPLINEMDIPIVVNSDCHYPTNVTAGFLPTFKALKNAGFKTMHQLFENEWQPVEFDEGGLRF
ncbi:MAG TPA: histidinol-phosphatase [Paludibacter sp.]|nr:histidinol-phosphatase [Paludibacter sp.]